MKTILILLTGAMLISIQANSVTTPSRNSKHGKPLTLLNKRNVDQKEVSLCEGLKKLIKKLKPKSYSKMETGSDYDADRIADFQAPYFQTQYFNSDYYEISYGYEISTAEDLMVLFKKYKEMIAQCDDLKFEKNTNDQVSKNIDYIYSDKISVRLKADTYHNRLSILIWREHEKK